MNIKIKWETDRESFIELTKDKFDKLCRAKRFIKGPIVENPNKNEYSPYNPHRWAIGLLDNGEYVCCDINC